MTWGYYRGDDKHPGMQDYIEMQVAAPSFGMLGWRHFVRLSASFPRMSLLCEARAYMLVDNVKMIAFLYTQDSLARGYLSFATALDQNSIPVSINPVGLAWKRIRSRTLSEASGLPSGRPTLLWLANDPSGPKATARLQLLFWKQQLLLNELSLVRSPLESQ